MFRIAMFLMLLGPGLLPVGARALEVVTDIEPVKAIVAQLAQGRFQPVHLVRRGSSGHDFALKPSMVARLRAADLIVWMGPGASPALAKILGQPEMASKSLMLNGIKGTLLLPQPVAGLASGAAPALTPRDDPHSWLDPENALIWADAITAALKGHDPLNRDDYQRANAQFKSDVRATDQDIQTARSGQEPLPFVQFHAAFQYFENRYDLHPLGIATSVDEHATSLGVMSDLRGALSAVPSSCLIVKDGPALKEAAPLTGIAGVRLGYANALAPVNARAEFTYAELLSAVADGIFSCLGPSP